MCLLEAKVHLQNRWIIVSGDKNLFMRSIYNRSEFNLGNKAFAVAFCEFDPIIVNSIALNQDFEFLKL